jgi:hypothetical protein
MKFYFPILVFLLISCIFATYITRDEFKCPKCQRFVSNSAFVSLHSPERDFVGSCKDGDHGVCDECYEKLPKDGTRFYCFKYQCRKVLQLKDYINSSSNDTMKTLITIYVDHNSTIDKMIKSKMLKMMGFSFITFFLGILL